MNRKIGLDKNVETKLNRLMSVVMPVKSFAALIFTGFIVLYMVMGFLYANILGGSPEYSIPFVFVFQGLILSVLISILRDVFLGGNRMRKTRYFLRLSLFLISIIILLTVSFSLSMAVPTVWASLWLIVAMCVCAGVIILSLIGELYFRATGKRYTKILEEYQGKRGIDPPSRQ